MARYDVVKPKVAEKRSLEGQSMVHCGQAITNVRNALTHDPGNQHLRRALDELRQVKAPEADNTKNRALRRV